MGAIDIGETSRTHRRRVGAVKGPNKPHRHHRSLHVNIRTEQVFATQCPSKEAPAVEGCDVGLVRTLTHIRKPVLLRRSHHRNDSHKRHRHHRRGQSSEHLPASSHHADAPGHSQQPREKVAIATSDVHPMPHLIRTPESCTAVGGVAGIANAVHTGRSSSIAPEDAAAAASGGVPGPVMGPILQAAECGNTQGNCESHGNALTSMNTVLRPLECAASRHKVCSTLLGVTVDGGQRLTRRRLQHPSAPSPQFGVRDSTLVASRLG